jgi:hypothetical protein
MGTVEALHVKKRKRTPFLNCLNVKQNEQNN